MALGIELWSDEQLAEKVSEINNKLEKITKQEDRVPYLFVLELVNEEIENRKKETGNV